MLELIASTLRLATPLLFAAMGGLLAERVGVATICLEGVLLVAAWAGATVAFLTSSPELGLIAGIAAGTFAMLLHALLCLTLRANHIISGICVNLFAAGTTPLLCKIFFGSTTSTNALTTSQKLGNVAIPWFASLPIVGEILFEQPLLVYGAWTLPFVLHFMLYSTRFGLRILATGDNPDASINAGIRINRLRYKTLLLGGAVASLGGVYLSMVHGSQFTRDMTSGRGFIALTAVIFGKWRPIPTAIACLLFGLTDALQIHLQGTHIGGMAIPVQWIQVFPYVVTLVVLAGFIGQARPPRSLEA